jgi:hypothetical protein
MYKNSQTKYLKLFPLLLCFVLFFQCERDKSPLFVWDVYPWRGWTFELKPNIYLYPNKETELDVKIIFPTGGEIIESIQNMNLVGISKWKNPDLLIENIGFYTTKVKRLIFINMKEVGLFLKITWKYFLKKR